MATFVLEDLGAALEVMVFPKTMTSYGHVLEEDARTETHGYIVDGQHNPPSIAGSYWDSMKGEGYPDGYGC